MGVWPKQLCRSMALLGGLLVATVVPGLGQTAGTVEGRIHDAETGVGIEGVQVLLEGTRFAALSGPDGTFQIADVSPGSYALVATLIGYGPARREVTVRPGIATRVAIELGTVPVPLGTVEVIGRREQSYKSAYSFAAAKTATAIVDVPQSISVVTKEVIADQQLYTLNETTRNVAGVNTFSGYDDLVTRGFRNQDTRLINGLRTSFGFWSSPILPHIERVEFIKGPASALFAAANPGGTINLVTKKPLPASRQAVSLTAGSFATYRAQVDFTGPLGGDPSLLYRLNVGYEDTESFRFLQGHRSYLVAPSVSFLPSERTRVNAELVYGYRDGTLDRGQAIFFGNTDLTSTPISFSLSQPGDYLVTENLHLTLSLEHSLADWLTLNTSYLKYRYDENLSEHRTSNLFLPDDPSVLQLAYIRRIQDRIVDDVTAYVVADLETGRVAHRALVGFDFYRQDDNRSQWGARGDERLVLADGSTEPGGGVADFDLADPVYTLNRNPETYRENWFSEPRMPEPARTMSHGGYVQDQLTLGRLEVLLGLRYEWHNTRLPNQEDPERLEYVEQTALVPRVGTVYGITDAVNAYATFTQGFEPQDAAVIQQPELYGGPFDPETSDLFEVGAKATFFDDRLLATAALYEITKRNVLVNANSPGQPELLRQRGKVRSRGLELEATGSIASNFQVTANYALNNTVITQSNDPEEVGRVNENAPRHQGGFWGRYTIARGALAGIGIGGGARFVTERNTFDRTLQLPGYTIFDLSLSYTVGRFRVTAYADNVLDERYWVGGYNYGRIYPGAPRTFNATVGYTF